jgi:hypothetical protein
MGKRYETLTDSQIEFIQKQHMFFVATADSEGRVNVSPKGLDSFRVLGANRVVWLNLTGSGNETAAHILSNNRITLMFCAYEGAPMILRIYGSAKVYHGPEEEWRELIELFPEDPGSRQIFDISIELVQTSCGYAVPLYDYVGQRDILTNWSAKKGLEGIEKYWLDRNTSTIDGVDTHIQELKRI